MPGSASAAWGLYEATLSRRSQLADRASLCAATHPKSNTAALQKRGRPVLPTMQCNVSPPAEHWPRKVPRAPAPFAIATPPPMPPACPVVVHARRYVPASRPRPMPPARPVVAHVRCYPPASHPADATGLPGGGSRSPLPAGLRAAPNATCRLVNTNDSSTPYSLFAITGHKDYGCRIEECRSANAAFSDVLSEEEIQTAFDAENADFARGEGDIYTPAITLWAFLSQVLNPGRLRSCAAAVSRVTVLCVALGRKPPSPDTGAYCRARAKLPDACSDGWSTAWPNNWSLVFPFDWLWHGRHVKACDGTTLTAPDTEENQRAWPQSRAQKPGLGFPIMRMVVLFSLATAAVSGVAVGPFKGKQTGEPALLRGLLPCLKPGDVFLGDCGFCSYALLALLLLQQVDVVVRQHQRRHTDFRRGRRLGKEDHVVQWQRPSRPTWMDEESYAAIPATLSVRELKVRVAIRGFRVRQLIVVTTLTDPKRYPKEEIAALFRQR